MQQAIFYLAMILIARFILMSVFTHGYGFYKIPKNGKFSRPFRFLLNFNKKSIKYRVMFDKSCRYELDKITQIRGQKVFGTSTNFSFHHRNSIRYIFRYLVEDDRIQIGYSYYDKGKRTIEYFPFELSIDVFYELEIRKETDSLVFYIDGIETGRIISKHVMIGYRLWPHFESESKRQNDIIISLSKPSKDIKSELLKQKRF